MEAVLIGICDGAIDKKKNASYFTNKIGDRPDILPVITLQNPMCTLCQRGLSHVVQVYCPLAESLYHRTINVFACTNPQCYGKSESWIVLRSQCLDDDIKASSGRQDDKSAQCKESSMSRTDWCDEADDWGLDDEEQNTVAESSAQTGADTIQTQTDSINDGMEVSSKLQDLCIDGGLDHHSAFLPTDVPIFQPFYISVMEETDLDVFHDTDHENKLLREYEEREGVIFGEIRSGEALEEYEKAKSKHGDEVFTSFMKKISLCPEQVLRYSWSGSPQFIMEPLSNFNQKVPCCGQCGSLRIFEFQLMPALVSLLCSVDTNSDIALEFGTVLVYTCRNSCWKSGSTVPVEEFLFVQPDPDQKLFK
ncbi:programmed cell death protein 2-like isoform X1 [Myxocyprinus asiaticus]|uniref:programmed cell death protein 2-like isoform X1 n=2 Tax=Myxocyprinus asiaticus TaxID=70543 RepID=UPI002223E1F0|nr:programmed cell death protein 2-like isoform X1 [Myxocyprinus asiaticus]